MMRLRSLGTWAALGWCVLASVSCAHIANETPNPSTTPTPGSTPGPGATPTPVATGSGSCDISTRDPDATIVISIDPDFATASSSYGPIFGYAAFDPEGIASLPTTAQVVSATTSDLIVFANYDPGVIAHSAAGFSGATSFPAVPFSFPSTDASAFASTISSSGWSTGSLASYGNTSSTVCYSQTFALTAAGTYYFGDDPLYNGPSSFRGVISVSH